MKKEDAEFLNWIADRLVSVHGESPNVDFVRRLRSIAETPAVRYFMDDCEDDRTFWKFTGSEAYVSLYGRRWSDSVSSVSDMSARETEITEDELPDHLKP